VDRGIPATSNRQFKSEKNRSRQKYVTNGGLRKSFSVKVIMASI